MPEATVIPLKNIADQQSGKILVQLDDIVLQRNSKRLLDGLSIAVRNGGITTLMGPNGAGKTLALRLMARLLTSTDGHVRECGLSRKDIALVFQKPVLLRRSVEGNLKHALKVHGVSRSQRPTRISKLLQMANLEHMAGRPARLLSGGEQQRLAMVRALSAQPKLLLLDEPTASLDPQATALIETLIKDASSDGVKIVLVTHDVGQARRLSSEIVFIHHGYVTEHTDARYFFDAPKSPEAQAYLNGQLLI